MGERKNRLERLRSVHPKCCFCAGQNETTTIEHAPPKAFFHEKIRLKGLEFPACNRCNNGSSQLDQVASWFAITMGLSRDRDADHTYWNKLSKGVLNNTPEAFKCLRVEDAESFWHVGADGSIEDFYKSKIDYKLFSNFLNPWAAKQAAALYFEHAGKILDENSAIWTHWITNYHLYKNGIPDALNSFSRKLGLLRQGRLNSLEQYNYEYAINTEEKLAFFQINAHQACVILACVTNGPEQITEKSRPKSIFRTNGSCGIHAVN
ncbi:hypothetical protein ANTHELSMS3_01844 [Antarctobacter heliothermus]|uniref:HNH endonuclease n=1 Tax=Antarctobacter heliothermus TaxID=74033 RepID=A0A222E3I7_9RHOB|nr:hypothetical protein [Antarctobacter heliothermus]ASP20531.1 hypothetical protein ANTHELSMS3_01844 [Antarctobacter heliothermus]